MKEYRAKIKQRLLGYILFLWIFCWNLAALSDKFYVNLLGPIDANYASFVSGFRWGLGAAVAMVLVMGIVRNIRALHSEALMNQLLIKEQDERTLYIWQKSGSVGMNIAMYGLLLATMVAGSFDVTVFFTLLGATGFVVLVRLGLKLYYGRKY